MDIQRPQKNAITVFDETKKLLDNPVLIIILFTPEEKLLATNSQYGKQLNIVANSIKNSRLYISIISPFNQSWTEGYYSNHSSCLKKKGKKSQYTDIPAQPIFRLKIVLSGVYKCAELKYDLHLLGK